MEPNETFVDGNESFEAELPEGLIVETGDESDVSLDEVIDSTIESEQANDEQPAETAPNAPKAKEPGYVKTRIAEALAKERESIRAEVQEEFNQRMAPILERLLIEDAKELVRQGEFKSLDRATEYLRMKQGMPAPADTEEQPRNSNGQFAPKQNASDAATQARIDMLKHQAESIKNRSGVDVIKVFNENPDIKKRVIAGEIDFYDVAEEVGSKKGSRKPPAPMRSPNGAASDQQMNSFMSMSSEEFRKLEKRIQQGGLRIRQK